MKLFKTKNCGVFKLFPGRNPKINQECRKIVDNYFFSPDMSPLHQEFILHGTIHKKVPVLIKLYVVVHSL